MKLFVNEACIGCGMCSGICPNVFKMSRSGRANAVNHEVDEADMSDALEAMDNCPVGAIEEE